MTESKEARAKRLKVARAKRYYLKKTQAEGGAALELPNVDARVAELLEQVSPRITPKVAEPKVRLLALTEMRYEKAVQDPLLPAQSVMALSHAITNLSKDLGLTPQEARLDKRNLPDQPETDEAQTRLLQDATFGRLVRSMIEGFADADAHAICPVCRRVKGNWPNK